MSAHPKQQGQAAPQAASAAAAAKPTVAKAFAKPAAAAAAAEANPAGMKRKFQDEASSVVAAAAAAAASPESKKQKPETTKSSAPTPLACPVKPKRPVTRPMSFGGAAAAAASSSSSSASTTVKVTKAVGMSVSKDTSSSPQSSLQNAMCSLHNANNLAIQHAALPTHLRPLLKLAVPHLDSSSSIAPIASTLWFGSHHTELADTVQRKCFHADPQSRHIIGVVQAYGCGKTKTGLRLSAAFILLPIRANINDVSGTTLIDAVVAEQKRLRDALSQSPTYQEVEMFTTRCLRLVELSLFALVALYDHCVAIGAVDPTLEQSRFNLALLLLNDNEAVTKWSRAFFDQHKGDVLDDAAYLQLSTALWATVRPLKIVFLLDEVHVLFDKCRGYIFHSTTASDLEPVVALLHWQREQQNGVPAGSHRSCTDLFYQFRLTMLNYLLKADVRCGFVMCSTMFRIWKVLEEENSPLSRGTITQFFHLHWFSHAEIKHAVLSLFALQPHLVDELEQADDGSMVPPYKRLSAYTRPLFLMQFLEKLCETFPSLPDVSTGTLRQWLRKALQLSEQGTLDRARDKLDQLVVANHAVDIFNSRLIIHLLYTTQRLCGGTLELAKDSGHDQALEDIISKGVARIDMSASRFRISDVIFAEALVHRYTSLADQNEAITKILAMNTNFSRALVSHDSAHKGYLTERMLAWLALSKQLKLRVHNRLDGQEAFWPVEAHADNAGTIVEFELGKSSAAEPMVLCDIMRGTRRVLLLPTTLAGPDLWMRATVNGVVCVVSLQSKVEAEVYTMKKFRNALKSLNPIHMYGSPTAVVANANWIKVLPELQRMPFHRIVFNACGFNPEVQYYVCEYNRVRGRSAADQPARFIHLLTLDDIKGPIGPLYQAISGQLSGTAIQPSLAATQFMLAHSWRSKSNSAQNAYVLADLQRFSKHRGITLDGKRKPQLRHALTVASQLPQLNAILSTLDPQFPEVEEDEDEDENDDEEGAEDEEEGGEGENGDGEDEGVGEGEEDREDENDYETGGGVGDQLQNIVESD